MKAVPFGEILILPFCILFSLWIGERYAEAQGISSVRKDPKIVEGDSISTIIIPSLNFKITYPHGAKHKAPRLNHGEGCLFFLRCEDRYDSVYLMYIKATCYDSVRNLEIRAENGEDLDEDAPGYERGSAFHLTEKALHSYVTGDTTYRNVFSNYIYVDGILFGHYRTYDEPGGCWVSHSETFIDSTRLEIETFCYADSLKMRIRRNLEKRHLPTRAFSDQFFKDVADSLAEPFESVLTRMHFGKINR
jgi:hypothetical protein